MVYRSARRATRANTDTGVIASNDGASGGCGAPCCGEKVDHTNPFPRIHKVINVRTDPNLVRRSSSKKGFDPTDFTTLETTVEARVAGPAVVVAHCSRNIISAALRL